MIPGEVYKGYVGSLVAGDRATCARIVQELVEAKVGWPELYTDLFGRALYEVGDLWERNQISVATEHLATAITESLMNLVRPALLASPRRDRRALIACCAHELHQVGAKMVADVFEMNGWDTDFLGANTPSEALVEFVGQRQPAVVGLSLCLQSNLPVVADLLDRLRERYPTLSLLVGGQAFRDGGREVLAGRPGVRYVPSIQELEGVIAGS